LKFFSADFNFLKIFNRNLIEKITGFHLKKSRSPSIPLQNFPPGPVRESVNSGVPLAGASTPTGNDYGPTQTPIPQNRLSFRSSPP
jgi:hypothetical protein